MNTRKRQTALVGIALAAIMGMAACGDDEADTTTSGDGGGAVSGEVVIDGSSTVEPLSSAAGELFKEENPDANVTVGTSGTGGGFEKFCRGETDISDASRAIKDEEAAACAAEGISYTELLVANDALTVVVNAENDFVTCLTVEQLAAIWGPDSTVSNWNQVDPSFPDEAIELFGPGTDSGTFTYFTDEINGEEGASRTDYTQTENDNVIVEGVSGEPGGMGYFGFTYFEENSDVLKAVEIDGGDGCVAPSADTVRDGTYTPLARPLYIYVANSALEEKPQVKAFVEFYIENSVSIAETALFVPLTDEQVTEAQDALAAAESGAPAPATT